MVAEKLIAIQTQARGNPKLTPSQAAVDYLRQTTILTREDIKQRIEEITKVELESDTVDTR